MLNQIDWKYIIDETDVNISWKNWQSAFLNVMSDGNSLKFSQRRNLLFLLSLYQDQE